MTFWDITVKLLGGFSNTVLLFVLTLVFAIPLGLVVAFGAMSKFKPLRYFTEAVIWVIRGTPLMLQLFVVFYVPGLLFKVAPFNRFTATTVAFVINYSCYLAVIMKGGIQAIPKGQYEAGAVLGLSKRQTFFRVIFMQVVKNILPPTSNEIITLVKDTSLARVIMVTEIIQVAYDFSATKALIWPLFYAGIFYLVFIGLLTVLFKQLEKKLSYYKV